MAAEEHLTCPHCGASISSTDKYCRNCGRVLIEYSDFSRNKTPFSTSLPPEEVYDRKYSMLQRFYRLVVSPSEAMKDIGLAPDYGGPVILVIIQSILAAVAISLAFQKIQWVGDSQIISQVSGLLSSVITLAVVIAVILYFAFWLVKSVLVKTLCDSGSGWSFGTAASVTGYAYLADIIFGIIGLVVTYYLIPTVTFNVSDLDAVRRAAADFQAQVLWIRVGFAIPFSFVGLLWKSYLGGLGTKFGTHEKCSLRFAFIVFLGLALLGWLISYLIRGTI